MSNISVAEILKIYGKWIRSEDFVNLVSEKLNISPRHAYNKIKKALKNGEILKETLPDRTVIYGLPEFGEIPKDYREKHGEKEIELTIKLPPLDEEERQREAELRYIAEKYELENLKLRLKFLEELRTIKIKGKNIEDIKEQLPKLIIETLEKTRKESKSLWKRKIKLPF